MCSGPDAGQTGHDRIQDHGSVKSVKKRVTGYIMMCDSIYAVSRALLQTMALLVLKRREKPTTTVMPKPSFACGVQISYNP